jgi:hypothetical protein
MKIAEEIMRQLGGRRFVVMTGAKDFCSQKGANWLEFKIGRNASKSNFIKITLTGNDDYTMEFFKVSYPRLNKKTWTWSEYKKVLVKKLEGIYCDGLQDAFTETTGLYTRLF